jgi:hypothetical protein
MSSSFEHALSSVFPDNAQTQKNVLRLLQSLQLDVPAADQYMPGHNGLLFSPPDAGVVIRVENAHNKRRVDHTLVIPTITAFRTGYADIDIVPGLRTSDVGEAEAGWVSRELRAQGIFWRDVKIGDVGRLPLATREHPKGLPVLIDPDFLYATPGQIVRDFLGLGRRLKSLEDYGVDPMQARGWRGFMQELTSSLQQAWPADSGEVKNPAAMTAFWQTVRHETSSQFIPGRPALFCGWNEGSDQMPSISPGSNPIHVFRPHMYSSAARAASKSVKPA